jgi:hypothetical protein
MVKCCKQFHFYPLFDKECLNRLFQELHRVCPELWSDNFKQGVKGQLIIQIFRALETSKQQYKLYILRTYKNQSVKL